jgi:putative ABC transport system substrate-binding protein
MLKTIRSVKIIVLVSLVVVLLSACGTGDGKTEQEKTYSVGILNISPFLDPVIDGFKDGMTELGYIEGENITYVYEGPDGLTPEQLVEAEVDLIFSTTGIDAGAAREVTDSIPIIFNLVADPVGIGLVEAVASPGGNVTGVMTVLPDARRLELLTEMAPGIKRVLVPNEPARPQTGVVLEEIRPVAEKLGLELVVVDAEDDESIAALQQSPPEGIDAIFLLGSGGANPIATPEWSVAAIEHGLPISSEHPLMTAEGVGPLMSYGTDTYEVGKQAAGLVDAILQGRDPAETPVLTAELFLTVNLQTADAIGLEISDDVLAQANNVIRGDE